jgi:negative regulator of sigma E activity
LKRLIEVAREDMQYQECDVKYFTGAKVNGRVCTVVQVTHPVPRPHFRYHVAKIFIDDELQLPIRFATYDWPEKDGGEARLMEEYTYLDLKLNVGLTDWDFDYRNENYNFRKDFEIR